LATAERELAPVMAQRQQFAELTDVYAALREQVQTRIEPLGVLDLLTELIPDDSWLQRLQVRGAQLTLVGQTTNTTALMNRLSEHPLVRDVRAPSAATRVSGGRENFIIELTLLPQALRADVAGAAAAGQSASVRLSRSDGSDPAAASVAVSASNPSAPVPAGAAPQASAVGGGAP
jgi:general secretion pathway protein L